MKLARLALGACALALLAGHAPQARAERVQFDPVYNHVVCDSGCTGGTGWNMAGLANIAVTNASARIALPTVSTNVWIINTGATTVDYALGDNTVVATTSSAALASGACALLAEGANTNIATISATSGNLQVQTGAGTPLSCGGGGGGGGGAVTAASGAYASGSLAAGAVVDIGTGATPAANTVNANLVTLHSDLVTLNATAANPIPPGNALVGKFGIDQTTPGATNGVQANIAAGGVVSGSFLAGSMSDGAFATFGLKADAATCATANTAMSCLRQLHNDLTGSIPAGSALIGVTGVAQGSTTSGEAGPLAQGAVTTANPADTTAQTSPLSLTITGALRVKQAPGTLESCDSGNVAAAVAACTLATAVGHTTYITSFTMSAAGSTAALPVTCTLTGVITGTKHYTFGFPAGVLVGATPLHVDFNPPLPASTTNTTIVASCPSGGTGNTNATMTAEGFQE